MDDVAQTAEGFGEDDPDLCVRAVLDMIDQDEIKADQASALMSALFRRIGRGMGKSIADSLGKDPKLGPLFKAPATPPVDLGLEDVSERSEGAE